MKYLAFPCLVALMIGCPPCGFAGAEPTAIVVNKSNPIEELTWGKLSRIYKGRMEKWPNGKVIVPINQGIRSPNRKTFYNLVLGARPTKKFLKPGTPIPFKITRMRSERSILKFVSRVPNAIGYLPLSKVDGTVKVLRMEGIAPGEEEYKLK